MRSTFIAALACLLAILVSAPSNAQQSSPFFGPRRYSLEPGRPQKFTDSVVVNSEDRCDGNAAFILAVANGDGNAKTAISSATIRLNGNVVADENEFSVNKRFLEIPIAVGSQNELVTELKGGQPASFLTVSIHREIEQDAVPPKTYALAAKRQTLQDAFAVSDPSSAFTLVIENGAGATGRVKNGSIRVNGATIVGEHELNERADTIRRPISLQSQNTLVVDLNGDVNSGLTLRVKRRVDHGACGPKVYFSTPGEGAIVDSSRIVVSGTAVGSKDIGITVNGDVADIDLSRAGTTADPFRWAVVLAAPEGTVVLQARAITPGGAKGTATRTIFFAPAPERVSLRAAATGGPAPLTMVFHVSGEFGSPVARYELDLDGNGVFETSSVSVPEEPTFTYVEPGLRLATLRVTGVNGRVVSSSVPIIVQPFAVMNAVIQQQWSRFVAALSASDIEPALGHLADDNTRRKYESGLRLIQPSLPRFAAGIRTIEPVWITANAAHYLMTRLEEDGVHGYHVYFVRDSSGVWKIAQF